VRWRLPVIRYCELLMSSPFWKLVAWKSSWSREGCIVAVCCSVFKSVAVCFSVFQCVAGKDADPIWQIAILVDSTSIIAAVGWLRLVGSLKIQVSFAKEPYKKDDILQKRPIVLRSLLIVATPYHYSEASCQSYERSFKKLHDSGVSAPLPPCRLICIINLEFKSI